MKLFKPLVWAAVTAWGLGSVAQASLTVVVDDHDIAFGSTAAKITISISGDDLLTDMVGFIQIGDGGPLVGGTPGPVITSISYAGSIWEAAPGGYTAFSAESPPSQILDPNVSLNLAGEAVAGRGVLMTLLVDVSGFRVGDVFALSLTGTEGGDTTFSRSGNPVAAAITNGSIRIVGAPAAVPEPASILQLVVLGALIPLARRRGRNPA